MLDIKLIRANPELIRQKCRDRQITADIITDLTRLDQRRRALQQQRDECNQTSAQVSQKVKRLLAAGNGTEAAAAKAKAVEYRHTSTAIMTELEKVEAEFQNAASLIPNMPHESVPVGDGPSQNQIVRTWGVRPVFSFAPRDHVEIGERTGMLDLSRASKLATTRFAIYRNMGARIERALASFMLDTHRELHGYEEVLPPFAANSDTLFGTGNLPKFRGELFHLEETDLWMIPTAEVPLTCLYRNEVLEAEQLPMKLTAWTPCFRREAGSYGKDTRGILRQHQFQKVELVHLVRPEDSYDSLEELVGHAEKILQLLGLHYRVVVLCTGDMGFASAKTYDLEVWLPSQGMYREISSCSNCEAFQARRANLRFRRSPGAKPEFIHTLNGSGLAIGRTWIALMENYQQEDGSIIIPEVLRPYLGMDRFYKGCK